MSSQIPKWIGVHGVVGHWNRDSAWSLLAREQDQRMAHTINVDIQKAFILGMELAMRIARNRVEDLKKIHNGCDCHDDVETVVGIIRIVQVEIGSGRMPLPEFSKEEIEEVERIS